jgi:hypothetical protein
MFPDMDFAGSMDEIVAYAIQWLDMLDDQRVLTVMAAFSVALTVILYMIKKVKSPPNIRM